MPYWRHLTPLVMSATPMPMSMPAPPLARRITPPKTKRSVAAVDHHKKSSKFAARAAASVAAARKAQAARLAASAAVEAAAAADSAYAAAEEDVAAAAACAAAEAEADAVANILDFSRGQRGVVCISSSVSGMCLTSSSDHDDDGNYLAPNNGDDARDRSARDDATADARDDDDMACDTPDVATTVENPTLTQVLRPCPPRTSITCTGCALINVMFGRV